MSKQSTINDTSLNTTLIDKIKAELAMLLPSQRLEVYFELQRMRPLLDFKQDGAGNYTVPIHQLHTVDLKAMLNHIRSMSEVQSRPATELAEYIDQTTQSFYPELVDNSHYSRRISIYEVASTLDAAGTTTKSAQRSGNLPSTTPVSFKGFLEKNTVSTHKSFPQSSSASSHAHTSSGVTRLSFPKIKLNRPFVSARPELNAIMKTLQRIQRHNGIVLKHQLAAFEDKGVSKKYNAHIKSLLADEDAAVVPDISLVTQSEPDDATAPFVIDQTRSQTLLSYALSTMSR